MSLRLTCRELVLEVLIRRAIKDCDNGPCLQLIVDSAVLRVISSFFTMSELCAEGIMNTQLISNRREQLPEFDAIYLLAPNADNVDILLADFAQDNKPQHRQVHLAFTQPLAADLLAKLAEKPQLPPRVRSFVEVPLNFMAIQDRGFHLDMLEALTGLFPTPDHVVVATIVRRLADVCRCLHVTTTQIRHAQSDICTLVAQQLASEFSSHNHPSKDSQVPCQLLILDRSFDIAAALVHEYTYEALLYDLLDGTVLDVDRNIVKVPGPPAKEVLLSDIDPLWEAMKHEHIDSVRTALNTKVNELVASQNMTGKASKISDLLNMLRQTPELKETIEKLNFHLDLTEMALKQLDETQLTTGFGLLEQDIACGVDKSGKDVKANNLEASLTRFFSDTGITLSSETKLRALMLYLARTSNVSQDKRSKLIDCAKLDSQDHYVLMNMLQMKLMGEHSADRGHCTANEQIARFKQNARMNARFELSRFEPQIKVLLEQLVKQCLSEKEFPVVENGAPLRTGGMGMSPPEPPAMRAGNSWSFASACTESSTQNPQTITRRVLIFVLGGITYSELRCATEVAKELPCGVEIYVGGTGILTPKRLAQMIRPRKEPEEV